MTDDNKKQWYFNTVKKQAELGMVSPIEQRMGPVSYTHLTLPTNSRV